MNQGLMGTACIGTGSIIKAIQDVAQANTVI